MSRLNWAMTEIFCMWVGIDRKQIESIISRILTVLFLSFGPKIFFTNQIAWIFYIIYLKKYPDLITYFLDSLSGSWLKPTGWVLLADVFQNLLRVSAEVNLACSGSDFFLYEKLRFLKRWAWFLCSLTCSIQFNHITKG